jgi:hypothetical protein
MRDEGGSAGSRVGMRGVRELAAGGAPARASPGAALRRVRLLHTGLWALFAGAILGIPVAAWTGAWRLTGFLIALVSVECVVLALNRMRCPLTDVAARYTDDRADNFDIYLPLWLARYNKHIFGPLFAGGVLVALVLWWRGVAG